MLQVSDAYDVSVGIIHIAVAEFLFIQLYAVEIDGVGVVLV